MSVWTCQSALGTDVWLLSHHEGHVYNADVCMHSLCNCWKLSPLGGGGPQGKSRLESDAIYFYPEVGAYAIKIDEQIQTPNSIISEMQTYLVSTGQELVASKSAIVVLNAHPGVSWAQQY